MPGETRVFISHTFEDNNACVPLTAALDAWEIPYHFDASAPAAAAPMLSPEIQQALTASSVFIRVCTRNTAQSVPISLESGAYRGLQAQRGGKQRTLINLILDPSYQREPFDNATLFIDATTKSRFDWLSELARALGITTVGRRLSRRSAIALGGAGVVAVASATSAGVVLARNRPGTTAPQSAEVRSSTASGQTKWTLTVARNALAPAVAAAGYTLYVYSDAGLEALSPVDGKTLWSQIQVASKLEAAVVPAAVNGVIYVVDSSPNLVAASARDGHVLWKKPSGSSQPFSSPAATSDGVYLLQDDGVLYAYKSSDGSPLWKAAIGTPPPPPLLSILRPPPSAAGGVVYVGSDDHNLYALNASDGSVKWKFLTRGRVSSTPAVANGRVYFGSEDGYVYAVNVSDHTQAWSYQTDFDVVGSPAVVNGIVYIGSRDRYLHALDAQHGFAYWRALAGDVDPNGGTIIASSSSDPVNCLPAVGYDTVYVTAGAFVYAFSIVDGKRLWRFKTNEQLAISSPVLIGNLVFAGADDKTLYAINI